MKKHQLGVVDCIIVGLSLLIASGIGVWFRLRGSQKNTAFEYLMAGRDVYQLPVILSATVTVISAASMISTPIEIYRYGAAKILQIAPGTIGIIAAAYIFIPVYFECGVLTVNEFLEMRYGTKLKSIVSGLSIMQMLFQSSGALYAPVLALNAVADVSPTVSIVVMGLVCTFYSTAGGLRGILWTDVFQFILMFTCVIALFSRGVPEAGGIGELLQKASDGNRLDIWNFSADMTQRYTIWGVIFKGFTMGFVFFGISQAQIQRSLSLRTYQRAKSSVIWTAFSTFILLFLCYSSGLVLYAVFYNCDPILDGRNTGLKKYDQIIPYYIVTRFSSTPGLAGLCIAGIFSGSLSTISSAINAASMVTVMDFVKPIFSKRRITEEKTVWVAKFFSAVYGLLCICITFAVSKTDALSATILTLLGTIDGPLMAVFLVAVLTRKGTEKCALFGLLFGVAVSSWIGYGALSSGYRYPPLPLSTTECPSQTSSLDAFQNSTFLCPSNSSCPSNIATTPKLTSMPFILYRVSYIWISWFGLCSSLLFILVSAIITGWKDAIPADSKCLSPVTRLWRKREITDKNKIELTADRLEERKYMIVKNSTLVEEL